MKKLLLLACLFLSIQTTKVFSQESKIKTKDQAELNEAQKTQIEEEIKSILTDIASTYDNFPKTAKFIEALKKYTTKHTKFILGNGNKIDLTDLTKLIDSLKLKKYKYTEDEFDFVSPKLVILSQKVAISGMMNNNDFSNNVLVKYTFHHYQGGWKLLNLQATEIQ